MTNRTIAAGDRFLQQGGRADQAVEELAVTHHLSEDDRLANPDAFFVADSLTQTENDVFEINIRGADCDARTAADAGANNLGGLVQAVEESGQNDADRTDVDMPEDVAADGLVDRADVGTSAALDTTQSITTLR